MMTLSQLAKCKLCGEPYGLHQQGTHACPVGLPSKQGFTEFHPTHRFSPQPQPHLRKGGKARGTGKVYRPHT